jgi:hypothetical protein
MDGQTYEKMDRQLNLKNGQMDGQTDERMVREMIGWTDR